MDHRRFVTFLVFFFAFTYVYTNLILPQILPPAPENAEQVVQDDQADGAAADGDGSQEAAEAGDSEPAAESNVSAADGADADAESDSEPAGPAIHQNQRLKIGSTDPESGYFMEVELNSAGACVESIVLADPKFRDLEDQSEQVQLLGNNATEHRTFTTALAAVDEQLKPHQMSLETLDWEVAASNEAGVTFSYESPDGAVRLEKSYQLEKVEVPEAERRQAFRTETDGYILTVDLKVSNLSDEELSLQYDMQGPVGVVLENAEHTRKYRDVKLEFLDDGDAVTMAAKAIGDLYEDRAQEMLSAGKSPTPSEVRKVVRQKDAWINAFRYAAVDVQFFAAIVTTNDDRPIEERATGNWIERTYPLVVDRDSVEPAKSDISFRMLSSPVELSPGESATHSFNLFAGPKRSDLLDPPPLEATQVLDYGSWFGRIARVMHWLLNMFYGWGMPYVLAIICLTVLVRGAMFPLSRKQAISAAKMKELQPKIKELQAKYGDDKQKVAQGQMELWKKHKINPVGGCLPIFFQLPIFISLYTCLNTAVDLRLSKFLWIDNLAAPDALFAMPRLPFLGSEFNVLPCITVVLFLIQQKLFMPPPADEQQEIQQKMMNFMTIFFGVMFWHVPAGLCIYFIASSMWGIAERKLLGNVSVEVSEPKVTVKEPAPKSSTNGNSKDEPEKPKGFFGKLMEAAEEAQRQQQKLQQKDKQKDKRKGNSNDKRNKKKR